MTTGDTPESAEAAHLAEQLGRLLAERIPGAADVAVVELSRSGAGTSRENWSFDAAWTADGERVRRALLLRRDPEASVVDSDRDAETGLLVALGGADLPTPVVLWADSHGERLERPYLVMERAAGTTDRHLLTERNPLGLADDVRHALAEQYCDLLAGVHRVDVDALDLPGIVGPAASDPARAEIDRWEEIIARDALEPQPGLAYVAAWLRDHVPPPPSHVALVHGDFRPANALVDDGRITVLLDWEFAHLGDPLEDVGWYCTPLYRREHFVRAAWEEGDFVARYQRQSGASVDPAALRFWQVLAMYKLAALALTGIRIFVEGDTDRPAAPVDRLLRLIVSSTAGLDRRHQGAPA